MAGPVSSAGAGLVTGAGGAVWFARRLHTVNATTPPATVAASTAPAIIERAPRLGGGATTGGSGAIGAVAGSGVCRRERSTLVVWPCA